VFLFSKTKQDKGICKLLEKDSPPLDDDLMAFKLEREDRRAKRCVVEGGGCLFGSLFQGKRKKSALGSAIIVTKVGWKTTTPPLWRVLRPLGRMGGELREAQMVLNWV